MRYRELKAVAAVACPVHQVDRGRPCPRVRAGCCSARRAAWQAWRRAGPVDVYLYAHHTFRPQSATAAAVLDRLASSNAIREPGGVRVTIPGQCAALILALTRAGLRVE